jgi:cytochrome P450
MFWNLLGVGLESASFVDQVKQYHDFFDSLIDSPATALKLQSYEDDSKFELNMLERLVLSLHQQKLSRKEVYDELLDFIIAGYITVITPRYIAVITPRYIAVTNDSHETSSHTLTFLLLDLCTHPHYQDSLYDSIKDIKDLQSPPPLDLFDRLLKESQRLHTIATGGIARECSQDTSICGFDVPKGTIVQANYRGLHLNPKVYEDPLEFKPERWLDKEANSKPFFPFAGGEHAW